MAKHKDPEDVAASIQRSIEVSPKGSRRVRCHNLRALFGFQAWTVQRKDLVSSLLESRGIRAQPPVSANSETAKTAESARRIRRRIGAGPRTDDSTQFSRSDS